MNVTEIKWCRKHDIAMEDGFCDLCEEELQQAFELEEAEEVAQA